ncbi:flagellar hook-associated protein 2 [Natronincola peptidivorans]|uniref:Flagellar hook-associated protein 2 n=1 Tax=Natronincola peptidivorans TaxID=426128 RepID=A0A1H9ZX24_9FIRM|nr:flagellar filament capping protein FliD [Natronincola peptidivorans]SES85925.1 flagellar hook-associated protein 2 [Natronincola peptidivorans]
MRIGGIASGMDTEQMVRDLMRAERMRIDRFFQQEQRLKWRQEAFNDINRTMANFILDSRKAFGQTLTSSTGTMMAASTSSFDWVKSAVSSNESVVKSTANANAMTGVHTLEVEQLAETANVTSGDLGELLNNDGTFKEDAHGSFTIKTDSGQAEFTIGNGNGEIKTINDLVRAINNATEKVFTQEVSLGLRAAYDADLGKMMISTRETGEEKSIQVIPGPGATVANKIFEENAAIFNDPDVDGVKGQNAIIFFNDSNRENPIEKPNNNFSIFGINLQLQAESTEPITIRVDNDVDSIVDKIKSFVEEYNNLLDEINGQLGQKHYRDFLPLTDEQKEAMSEKDIELWEEKAKSGLLRNDATLNRTLQTMRSSLYEIVENVSGSYNHITQIGITTGTYQEGGKLVIDEQKLRKAINNDADGVIDLMFKASPSNLEGQEKLKNSGLVQRVYDGLVDGMQEVIRQSGPGEDAAILRNVKSNILIDFVTKQSSRSVLDRDLSSINNRIAREEMLLARREDRYWQQFTAMEKALSEMQNQSSWLMQQMGMGQQF